MTRRGIVVLLSILAVALLARGMVVISLSQIEPMQGDSYAYYGQSVRLMNGQNYVGSRAPGYSALLAAAQYVFGGNESTRVYQWANVALGVFGVLGVYVAGIALHGRRLGELAAAVVALDPRYVTHVLSPMVENAYVPILIWSLTTVIWSLKNAGAVRGFSAGVMLGLAAMTRNIALPFVAVPACAALILGPKRWRGNLFVCVCMISGTVLTIVPWTVRNYRAYNRFIPVSYHDGLSLVDGNVIPKRNRKGIKSEAKSLSRRLLADDDPQETWRVEYNALLRQAGMEAVWQRQPGWILEKTAKFGPELLKPYGWFLQRGLDDPEIFGESGVKILLCVFVGTQAVILLLAPFGIGRSSLSPGGIVLILYVLYSFFVHITSQMIQVRYQLPYMWIIILFACRVFVDRPPWNWRRVSVTAACLVVVGTTFVANVMEVQNLGDRVQDREARRRINMQLRGIMARGEGGFDVRRQELEEQLRKRKKRQSGRQQKSGRKRK